MTGVDVKRICVNCGSSPGFRPEYLKAARELGTLLVSEDLDLVYGGSDVGLMGELADAAMEAGGTVIGIIPSSFAHKVSHRGISELHVVSSMHERKAMMFDLSDAFLALPGGYGTIEEVTEVLTWAQLGLHRKPCGLLNVCGYFDPFLLFLDHAVREGFIRKEHRDLIAVSDAPRTLLKHFEAYVAPIVEKWIGIKPRREA
jgi:uncharacterized protein (TIGR00730 family)